MATTSETTSQQGQLPIKMTPEAFRNRIRQRQHELLTLEKQN